MPQAKGKARAVGGAPLASIVLPVHNGERYLKGSIDSCLSQTYPNVELVVVDDASTDSTPSVLQSYKDPRMRVITHDRNRGLPATLNTGFRAARGDLLTWTSDDNCYDGTAIEEMAAELGKGGCDFVFCDFYRFDDSEPSKRTRVDLSGPIRLDDHNGIGACFLYTRAVMRGVGGYDEEAMLAEDYDYWLRVNRKFRMRHMPRPLYYYREHGRSLSQRVLEVQMASVLVRLKNRYTGVDAECDRILQLAEMRYPAWLPMKRHVATALFRMGVKRDVRKKRAARLALYLELQRVLTGYADGKAAFKDAKAALVRAVSRGERA